MSSQVITNSSDTEKSAVIETPPDSLGRRTPRGTVNGFLDAVANQNYIRASQYLNLKKAYKKDKERQRVVLAMQQLLDQGGHIIPYSMISDNNEGRTDDQLAPGIDVVGSVSIDGKVVNLLVEDIETSDGYPLWVFSSQTVNAIAIQKVQDTSLLSEIIPDSLKDKLIGGVSLGHWLAVLVSIALSYFLGWIIITLLLFIIRKIWRKTDTDTALGLVRALKLPFQLYLSVWVFVVLSQRIGISIIIRQRFSAITVTVGIVAFLILLWRITDFISNYSKNKMSLRGRISAVSVILFLRRMFKIIIVVCGVIAILAALGIDVTTGLAALGIGGIALALGAQKTVENFVGGVTLITDQPIRVGDFCKVDNVSGTVEQIGMRSTKFRTGERTIVTIPNGDLASSKIENFAHRDRFLFNPVIELKYETKPDQIRYLLVELRALLYAHPHVSPDPARVRFSGFAKSSLNLEFWAYITTPSFDSYLEVKEDLMLRIMDIVAAGGTDFAFPSQTIYIAKDKGISKEKATEVINKVNKWKEENNLQIPSFSHEKINELKNKITYPPEGSVQNNK